MSLADSQISHLASYLKSLPHAVSPLFIIHRISANVPNSPTSTVIWLFAELCENDCNYEQNNGCSKKVSGKALGWLVE